MKSRCVGMTSTDFAITDSAATIYALAAFFRETCGYECKNPACLERLFDEQTAKTETIDKEIARDALADLQSDQFDEAVFGSKADVDDLALGLQDSAPSHIPGGIAGTGRRRSETGRRWLKASYRHRWVA